MAKANPTPYEMSLEIGYGDDTETYILTPTVSVMRRIDRQFGGVAGVLEDLRRLRLSTVTALVQIGADVTGDKEKAALERRVFATGIGNVTPHLVEFIGVVSNGGRPLDSDGDDAGGGDTGNG